MVAVWILTLAAEVIENPIVVDVARVIVLGPREIETLDPGPGHDFFEEPDAIDPAMQTFGL